MFASPEGRANARADDGHDGRFCVARRLLRAAGMLIFAGCIAVKLSVIAMAQTGTTDGLSPDPHIDFSGLKSVNEDGQEMDPAAVLAMMAARRKVSHTLADLVGWVRPAKTSASQSGTAQGHNPPAHNGNRGSCACAQPVAAPADAGCADPPYRSVKLRIFDQRTDASQS
jgi:hypothetical protein